MFENQYFVNELEKSKPQEKVLHFCAASWSTERHIIANMMDGVFNVAINNNLFQQ